MKSSWKRDLPLTVSGNSIVSNSQTSSVNIIYICICVHACMTKYIFIAFAPTVYVSDISTVSKPTKTIFRCYSRNAAYTKSVNIFSSACSMALLFSLRQAFTLENSCSIGDKSGEYGGRKWNRAPVLWMSSTDLPVWWMEQLSIITILRGFTPLNGINCGKSLRSTTSQNTSPSTPPVVQWTSRRPSTVTEAIEEIRFPWHNSLTSLACWPKVYIMW